MGMAVKLRQGGEKWSLAEDVCLVDGGTSNWQSRESKQTPVFYYCCLRCGLYGIRRDIGKIINQSINQSISNHSFIISHNNMR